ncbi:MAG: DUF5787 family protein [Salinigranum sp.]
MSYRGPGDSEFVFELLTCRWAERAWPPASDGRRPVVVARQLGTRERRWDTVVIEVDPGALARRAAFGDRALDSDLLHVVRHAPAEWAWYRDALPHPGYPWRYVLAAVHRAAGRGVLEERRRGNRVEIRRIAPYPTWVRRVVAIENKPDLDASAARALSDQLAHDVASGLADEVWVATSATGERVEPALLEDLPVEVGILAMDFEGHEGVRSGRRSDGGGRRTSSARSPGGAEAEVLWHPGDLGGPDGEAARETRLAIAERAYGSGWRSYVDTMRPDCRHFELRRAGAALVPWCAAKERHQTQVECAGSCASFEPEPPGWRTRGWPIEGGPGKAIKRLLRSRREWMRGRSRSDTDATK